jgi:hypothetical protein
MESAESDPDVVTIKITYPMSFSIVLTKNFRLGTLKEMINS